MPMLSDRKSADRYVNHLSRISARFCKNSSRVISPLAYASSRKSIAVLPLSTPGRSAGPERRYLSAPSTSKMIKTQKRSIPMPPIQCHPHAPFHIIAAPSTENLHCTAPLRLYACQDAKSLTYLIPQKSTENWSRRTAIGALCLRLDGAE